MEQQRIELRKERDVGQIINATFSFISQEFKSIVKVLSYLVIPAILIVAILGVYFQNKIKSYGIGHNYSYFFSAEYWGNILLLVLMQLITHTLLLITIYSYVKIYVTKGTGEISISEMFNEVRMWFWKIFGTNIAIGFIIVIGIILFIIPGIYMAIPLSLLTAIMIFEDKTMSQGFDRCFKLVRKNWWKTFLLALIIMLIVYSISMALSIPFMILGFVQAFHSSGNMNQLQQDFMFSNYYIISTTIQTIVGYICYIILYIAYSIQYFNLVEQKERPSLSQKIENMGQEKSNTNV